MGFVVTGGLGFIGSRISRKLSSEGKDVCVVDNLHTGTEANLQEGCRLIKGNSGGLGKMGITDVETIFHNGIWSSSPMYREDPSLVSKAIAEFVELMEFARKADSRVVLAGTSSIYNGVPVPQGEGARVHARDFYSEARHCMERISEVYSRVYGLDAVVLRYFSVYGPGERHKGSYANLISQFIWAAEEGREILLYGDGTQSRDFIYVEDVVEANMLASGFRGFGLFNVGTGKSCCLNDAVRLIGEISGKGIKARHVENPVEGYVEHTLADTRKAENELGFISKTGIEEGIRKTIDSARG